MKAASRGFSPLRRAQRGVAAVFAAVSLLTLLAGLGLAIDVGRFYYAKRDLQRLADLAAIDGARMLSQCLGPAGADEISAEVAASLVRNRLPERTTTLTALGGEVQGADGMRFFAPAPPGTEPGVSVTLNTGSSATVANKVVNSVDAVQVTLSRESPSRILPLFQGEPARTLSVRAAASASSELSLQLEPPIDSAAAADLKLPFYNGALRSNLAFGGRRVSDAASATVQLSELRIDTIELAGQLPNADSEIPVPGLLSQLQATLDDTGDSAGAQLVGAYADAVAAGRPGDNAIPAEVLGLSTRDAYDGGTATTGAILDAVAGALSGGEVIPLPDVCSLVPAIRDLPTAAVLPALCDSSVELSLPQGSRPFTTDVPRQVLSLDTTDADSAQAGSGLVRVRLGLVNPINDQRITVPLLASVRGARATGRLRRCAALGQGSNVADVLARGSTAEFTVGQSGRFQSSFGTPTVDLVSVLDDAGPVPVITASVGDVLRHAGLNALAGNPLFAGLMGQSLTVSAFVPPVVVGDASERQFCMELTGTPPRQEATTRQCNGAPAQTGGMGSADLGRNLPPALGNVQLSVQLPGGLPPLLAGPLQQAVDDLTADLSQQLGNVLNLVAAEVLAPTLGAATLEIGAATVRLTGAGSAPPEVFAR